ncbi:DUF58 domain-containing protein [Paracoccus aminovorans]|uniref:DUF58 domain-containing protein n=1 Tax=Paracoccus aminovorans TaxID=34004 RepID=UPI0009E89EF5|nr:DUF58 domain-containing protein [Paracoccus aminovorans]MDQ7774441.1 DUF58 domain-containing protein [Paracoccus aminovorans]
MVGLPAALDRPGLRLTAAELMALRPPARMQRQRPASRRPGAIPARVAGQGMDLREIRAFAEGDDLRRIDPAATARTGQLHVRSFHEDRDDSTLLIADFRPAMLWGTGTALRSVRAARHLAMLGWRAVGRGGSVGLLVLGAGAALALNPAGGVAQMQAVALAMARGHDAALLGRVAGGADAPALAPALAQAMRMLAPGGRVHLATGPEGPAGADAALRRLAQSRRFELHLVLDPAETAPPAAALAVSDGSHSRHGRLSRHDPQPLLAHLRALGAHSRLVTDDDAG